MHGVEPKCRVATIKIIILEFDQVVVDFYNLLNINNELSDHKQRKK